MRKTQEIHVAGFRWRLVPTIEPEQLLGPGGLRLEEWLEQGQGTIVKRTPHRVVYRITLPGLDFHVKHYRGDTREWFRRFLRGSRASREFAVSSAVADRGVPTLEVLGFGECSSRRGPADSFLLTRTLPGAVPLLDFLDTGLSSIPPGERPVLLQRLARAVGTLLARQHQAGVRHHDLHPGNLLVRFAWGEPELFLIDLPAARLGKPLAWPAARDNLVVLDRWFAPRWGRTDRCRAWRAYCAARPELGVDERDAARSLSRATQASLLEQVRRAEIRSLGGNRHFVSFAAPGIRGHAVADLDPDVFASLLRSPDAFLDQPGSRVLKRSPNSEVVELELTVAGRPQAVVVKRVDVPWWRRLLAAVARRSQVHRSYVGGHGLRLRGLPTPRPLAVWQCWGERGCRDYLLVEKVPEAVELREFVEGLLSRPAEERRERLRAVAEELGRLLRLLHGWRLSHRDLKAANVLVSPAGWTVSARGLRELPTSADERRDRIWFIDLVGLRRHRKLGRERQVRDLARLHVSFLDDPVLTRTDRLRFLRAYLAWALVGKAGWKGWWRDIDRAARQKARRNRRQGRPIS